MPEVNRDEVHAASADTTKPSSSNAVRTRLMHNTIMWSKAVGPPGANSYTPGRTISASPPSRYHGAVPPMAPQATNGGGRGLLPQSFGFLQQNHVGGRTLCQCMCELIVLVSKWVRKRPGDCFSRKLRLNREGKLRQKTGKQRISNTSVGQH